MAIKLFRGVADGFIKEVNGIFPADTEHEKSSFLNYAKNPRPTLQDYAKMVDKLSALRVVSNERVYFLHLLLLEHLLKQNPDAVSQHVVKVDPAWLAQQDQHLNMFSSTLSICNGSVSPDVVRKKANVDRLVSKLKVQDVQTNRDRDWSHPSSR